MDVDQYDRAIEDALLAIVRVENILLGDGRDLSDREHVMLQHLETGLSAVNKARARVLPSMTTQDGVEIYYGGPLDGGMSDAVVKKE